MGAEEVLNKIQTHDFCVGVIGLGYVGLPLLLAFAKTGFRVIGFDIDPKKVATLRSGKSYIRHIENQRIKEALDKGKCSFDTTFKSVPKADALIVCVPTPLTKQREPDLYFITSTGEMICPYLRKNQLVVLESTSYPGTTKEDLMPVLEKSGLKAGRDFYMAFSPEREDPGNPTFSTTNIPKVVGGLNKESTKIATALYSQIISKIVPVSNMETAEAVKLSENIFRAVNIALVNELKMIYSKMGIDIWEVVEAAKTKPFGYMPFYPGPGLGGHCIPIDPFYLTWKAREYNVATRFIELAGEINTSMPDYVVHILGDALNKKKKSFNGSKILVIGLAYKKDVDDTRESPSFFLIEKLMKNGARVDYYDPHVPQILPTREHKHLIGKKSVGWSQKTVSSYDVVLISTPHSCIDYNQLVAWAKLVVDTRNATVSVKQGREKIVKA
jgi:UDP-N-acetyl-D-glucosamine dehydrogenase